MTGTDSKTAPFDSILIANRGEIAVRVIVTARRLGLRCVAVYSSADTGAAHVALADEAVLIGDGPAADSYLDGDRLIAAARLTGAGAIHPGYGFLSENADFAEAVVAAGLVFVGPGAGAIRSMGDKATARKLMQEAGVACVPGYDGADGSDAALAEAADVIGYPVMIKAAAGGGGRGIRLVGDPDQLAPALALARAEAAGAFGSDRMILEKAIVNARHVEVQIFADRSGNCIYLGERDCSLQRRHQKLIEEAPCPALDQGQRDRMGRAAVAAARAVGYVGAGTVEFLVDDQGAFHFLEMNTRLQVEHPVTEMITGLDLVAWQIAVAGGAPLPLCQQDVTHDGHAIEARLCAEDPARHHLPATGRVDLWLPPAGDGIRVDAGIRTGQRISAYYDPLLAKVIAHGPDRRTALTRLRRALADTVLLGVPTNVGFLHDLLGQDKFVRGQARLGLPERAYPDGFVTDPPQTGDIALAAAILTQAARQAALGGAGYIAADQLNWSNARALPYRLVLDWAGGTANVAVLARPGGWQVRIADAEFDLSLEPDGDRTRATIDGRTIVIAAHVSDGAVQIASGARRHEFTIRPGEGPAGDGDGDGRVIAPMPGLVVEVSVAAGSEVARGDTLAVLEAMKMRHRITAATGGTLRGVHVRAGQQLAAGDLMFEIATGQT